MSDYERRYEVHTGFSSHYVDEPEEALRLLNAHAGEPNCWVNLGHADYRDVRDGPGQIGGTIITRRTTRSVSRAELEFLAQRAKVQRMLTKLRGA